MFGTRAQSSSSIKSVLLTVALTTITLAAVIVLALQPLWAGHVPWQGDGLLHIYRLAALERSIAAGDIFPRWQADLGWGYGFPLFHYYAAFSYYIALPIRWMGASLQTAINWSYGMALFVLAGGAYLWSGCVWIEKRSATAGIIAAVAAVYNPYVLYNLHHRSALAELWGLAFLTLTAAAVAHLSLHNKDKYSYWLLLFGYAGLLLSHNITAMIGTPLIIGYGLAIAFLSPRSERTVFFARLSTGLILGLVISAFFWLPAFAERELVQIERLVATANFSYVNHFLDPLSFFSWPLPTDPALVNQNLPLKPSIIQLLTALVGMMWLFRQRSKQAKLLGAAVAVCVFMTLSWSQFLWDALPLLSFVQFPWRFLGPAAIGLAIWTAYPLTQLWESERLYPAALIIIALILAEGLFYLFPTRPPAITHSANRTDLIEFERSTGWLGTTAAGDYLPRTVAQLPDKPFYAPAITQNINITANQSGRYVLNQFAFPGWTATVDGRPVEIMPTQPHGLISIELPQNAQTISFEYANTPLQRTAHSVSLAGVLLIMGGAILQWRRPVSKSMVNTKPDHFQFHWRALATLLIASLFMAGAKSVFLDQINSPWKIDRLSSVGIITQEDFNEVNFSHEMILSAVEIPNKAVPADQEVDINLYWQTVAPSGELSVGIHLLDENGRRVAQSDHLHPAGIPTTRWLPNQYGIDQHTLAVAPGTPPGIYRPVLFVYNQANGQRLDVLYSNAIPIGPLHQLDLITLLPPESPPILAEIEPLVTNLLPHNQAAVATGAELWAYDLPIKSINVGERLPISLYWHRTAAPLGDLPQITLTGTNNHGHTYPLSAHSPQQDWETGRVQRDDYRLAIPADFPNGRYTLSLNQLDLGQIEITAPVRATDLPDIAFPQTAQFGDIVKLHGTNISADNSLAEQIEVAAGNAFQVDIILEVLKTAQEPVTVFVQLLNADSFIAAQHDSSPANIHPSLPDNQQGKQRPATGWLAGEILVDPHQLIVPSTTPPGRYQLIVGMYNPTTLQRLPIGESNFLVIDVPIEVKPAE